MCSVETSERKDRASQELATYKSVKGREEESTEHLESGDQDSPAMAQPSLLHTRMSENPCFGLRGGRGGAGVETPGGR